MSAYGTILARGNDTSVVSTVTTVHIVQNSNNNIEGFEQLLIKYAS